MAPAWVAMKAAFAEQIRTDTTTPVWLSKDQISTWRAAQVKDGKAARLLGRKAENGEWGVAGEVSSAGAAPAPPPSKRTKTAGAGAGVQLKKGPVEKHKTKIKIKIKTKTKTKIRK